MNKKKIIAAGGLVTNANDELVMIYSRERWDLPKGKLDDGETIEHCAIREVEEETGLKNIVLADLIGITYHEYFDKYVQEDVIKETHWYAMQVWGEQKLQPQTEEDITAIEWTNKTQINEHLQNTYPNIIEIVQKYLLQ
jgi:8-oxo-dGTP pyrophosphatase MutT (NUDIX family)